ncbi:unnamed protein product [Bursaphelenchus okinawaensis]|uniref:Dystroglycan-type cadherin-like domain-containing protein n=1 Tax=Bursaphelenchus okinawaensis TaxID=465554 RepID=A0A811KMT8_9BILA|nr:unnamed protein product [Bursaphelenchus okinawaensis]CAG9106861.1 unnamed protein product [Bursaphelenchus okinawaensis]
MRIVLAAILLCVLVKCHIQKTTEIRATKGRFMTHMLHSAYFFGQSVNVKWTATAQGKPELPVWIHLAKSRHQVIAYLVGTPVTPLPQVTIHIIARRTDTYESASQFITILLDEDIRFNTTTQQLVEIKFKNIEPEDFYSDYSKNNLKRLENVIHRTFPGKGVNPYIFNIIPEFVPTSREESYTNFNSYYPGQKYKTGSIIQVGTQSQFHPNIQNFARYNKDNPEYCTNNGFIPLDKHFRNQFDVDWCRFNVKNMTLLRGFYIPTTPAPSEETPEVSEAIRKDLELKKERLESRRMEETHRDKQMYQFPYYFWQSVVIFPLLAVLCIGLILALSIIFFGRREGQQWRDYKTPKEQLHEYLNVRESQRHLRELSVQRQMLLMNDRSKSNTPLGVQAFLQPRGGTATPSLGPKRSQTHSEAPRIPGTPRSLTLPRRGESQRPEDDERRFNTRSSVGKQTVAEAALATGSSLCLYRNPLELEDGGLPH